MKKALFIIGPTGVGKTEIAFEIAKSLDSILISADSVQVYRGTDIISGKDIPKNSQFVEDHFVINSRNLYLVDAVKPEESFSVYDFVTKVKSVIDKNSEKTPIVVGGTRFYINALINKIDTLSIPPDLKLREKLTKHSVSELQKELKKTDLKKILKMNSSDINNPRRLIRAIEVSRYKNQTKNIPTFKLDDILVIGLTASLSKLKEKIDKRIDKRLKQGAIEEATELFKKYDKLSMQVANSNGFIQLFKYFRKEVTIDVAINEWKSSEYQLAKEQIKWVDAMENIALFDVEKEGYKEEINSLVKQHFSLKI